MGMVYAVEAGAYSDYRIDSIWSTRELAERRVGLLAQDRSQNDNLGVVEWTVDDPELDAERLTWEMTAYINRFTGDEFRQRWGPRATVTSKPYGVERHMFHKTSIAGERGDVYITVRAESGERAEKVMGETVARIKAEIDQTGPLADEQEKE